MALVEQDEYIVDMLEMRDFKRDYVFNYITENLNLNKINQILNVK